MNYAPIALVCLVILVSGCTSIPGFPIFGGPTVETERSDILVIKDLSAIPPSVSPGQSVKISAFVENIGTEKIPQSDLQLSSDIYQSSTVCGNNKCESQGEYCGSCPQDCGDCRNACGDTICDPIGFDETPDTCPEDCPFAVPITDQTIRDHKTTAPSSIIIQLFDYCKGLYEDLTIDSMECSGENRQAVSPTTCKITELLPGQGVIVDWNLVPENVDHKTVCPSDGMKVLVRYPYKTTSLTTLQLINQKELQQQIESGALKPVESYITLGEGPVKPILTVEDKQPIAITDNPSGPSGSTVISLQLENKGNGFVSYGEVLSDYIRINFNNPSITPASDDECNFELVEGTTYKPKEQKIKIIKDKSPKLFCKLDIKEYVPKITSIHMDVSIEYEYEFRDSEKVTVEPKF